jgi:hypothetical protein
MLTPSLGVLREPLFKRRRRMKTHSRLNTLGIFTVALILLVGQARDSQAQGPSPQAVLGTGFTYQGQLNKNGVPVNDTCSFTFSLWDSLSNGTGQVGASQTINSVTVEKGLFTVLLNGGSQFGASAFTGQARWLQTSVKCTGDSSPVTLSRQQLTAAPYALFASAPWVTSGTTLSYTLGNVGIGTPNPSAALSVVTGGATQPTAFSLPTGVKVGTAAGTIPLAIRQNGPESGTPALALFETASGNLGSLGAASGTFVLGAAASHGLGFNVNGSTRAMTIVPNGNVGIGTNSPSEKLTVQTSPSSYGLVHTDGTVVVGTWVGTGGTGSNGGWFGTKTAHPLRFFTGNGGPAMSINTDGDVAIGREAHAGVARLAVQSASPFDDVILAINSNGNYVFSVVNEGGVWVGSLNYVSPTTSHVCADGGWLTRCSSAAEYVPSVNSGSGFPETADLVSIAPTTANPYGDTHAPFAVEKSSTACDPNLLGFIVNPASGADGEKKNDHYLPLAIYGYFPAKVTLENGAIKRGDPLTSSSKPGYAMKATSACKTIGYALEDAQEEGTIQVFAQHGETTASEVTELRTQVDNLKKQNDALASRLDAIEHAQVPVQTGQFPNSALLWGALAVVGVVVARRWQR